ncbi:hypothetical protein BH23PAT2_BH23PAT2_03820 [soil metagenome]
MRHIKTTKQALRTFISLLRKSLVRVIRHNEKTTTTASLEDLLSQQYGIDSQKTPKNGLTVAIIIRDGLTHPKSSSFIRLISPLTDDRVKEQISIKIYPENTTNISKMIDVCIIQRTAYDDEATASTLLNNLKKHDIKLVVDSDDAFNSIDASHPEFKLQKERVAALNKIVKSAEEVWLSTSVLAKSYTKQARKIVVMPNTLDKRLWQHPASISFYRPKKKSLQLIYMGTATHDADFEMILPALDQVASKHPDSFELTVIGVSKELPERRWIKRVRQPQFGAIYPNFVHWFKQQGPFDIGLSPLVDSKFNRGKSDIKCLDYLAAGILPVVSDVKPYSSTNLDKYIVRVKNTATAWENQLSEYIEDSESFRDTKKLIVDAAQDYIWSKRSSEKTGKKMILLLQELSKKK